MRRYDHAIYDYSKAIEINPGLTDAYSNRGTAYLVKGKYDQAIYDFTQVIDLAPESADSYNKRGNAYFSQGRFFFSISGRSDTTGANVKDTSREKTLYMKALSDYAQSIELDPENADAFDKIGLINLVDLGNLDEGCSNLKVACKLGKCKNYRMAMWWHWYCL